MDASQLYEAQPIVNITGEKVALGPHRRDLIPLYQHWINNFGTLTTLLSVIPGPMTLEQENEWYEQITAAPSGVHFTIYERNLMQPIGVTSLHEINHRDRTASFGIMIGEEEARGRGYGTEATMLMLDYGFTVQGLHNVMLLVVEFNHAGIRAYEKAGFREFGRRTEARYMGGKWWDDVYMQALSTDFSSPVLGEVFKPDEPRDRGE